VSYLVLHGGAGPGSVRPFAARLPGQVEVPTHPGFDGTVRPAGLAGIPALAAHYAQLLDERDLLGVTVIGNSVGGWVAAELALLGSPRVARLVLLDAVGLAVPGHPVTDFFALTAEEALARTFHDPARFRGGPPPAPGNRAALEAYAGRAMADPTLGPRLATLDLPTLVLWGEADRIVDPDYGRAYAAAIPGATFALLPHTGHAPQLESPDLVLAALDRYRP
jgi:pimeloyl-ACP methyl ester carboxylesterase